MKYPALFLILLVVILLPDPFANERFPFGEGLYMFDGQTRLGHETLIDHTVDKIQLEMWPGEHEAFQILRSEKKGTGNIFINAWLDHVPDETPDENTIPQKEIIEPPQIEIYLEHYVEIRKTNIDRGILGSYPDALIPWPLAEYRDIGPSDFNAFYIRVITTEETIPGTYEGTISMNFGGDSKPIPFTVRVLDYYVTSAPLPFALGASASSLKKFIPVIDYPEEDLFIEFASLLMEAHASPIGLDFLTHPTFNQPHNASSYNFDRFDLTYSYFTKSPRMQFPYTFNDVASAHGITDADVLDKPWEKDVSDYIGIVADHIRANQDMDKFFCYVLDEPNTWEEYWQVMEFGQMVKSVAPDLDFLVTEQPYRLSGQEEWADIGEVVDIWCPQLGFWREEECRQVQAEGKEIWIYPNQRDFKSLQIEVLSPTLNIGDHYLAPRILTSTIYKLDIDGLLYWESMYWKNVDPYDIADPSGFTQREFFGNGDGLLFYPGDLIEKHYPALDNVYKPTPSLRWMNLVEGLEDYRLFCQVEYPREEIPSPEELLADQTSYSEIISAIKQSLLPE